MSDAPELHNDTERNKLLNKTVTDLDRIINAHDPETDVPIKDGVWDRLDKLALALEARADLPPTPEQIAADPRVQKLEWKPIETAPEGKPRITGASTVYWLRLAWLNDEGEYLTGDGMRVNDKFYVSAVFHCGGPFNGKQFHFKEIEVSPTHWMPSPEPPTALAEFTTTTTTKETK